VANDPTVNSGSFLNVQEFWYWSGTDLGKVCKTPGRYA